MDENLKQLIGNGNSEIEASETSCSSFLLQAFAVAACLLWLASSLVWAGLTSWFYSVTFMFGDTFWELDWFAYADMAVIIFSWFLIILWPILLAKAAFRFKNTGKAWMLVGVSCIAFVQLPLCYFMLLLLEKANRWWRG